MALSMFSASQQVARPTCAVLTCTNPPAPPRGKDKDSLASALSDTSLSVPGLREARHRGRCVPAHVRGQLCGEWSYCT